MDDSTTMKTDDWVEIYTDGACKGNPGPGGWGAYFKFRSSEKELYGGEIQTTNNRMELIAVIEAIKYVNKTQKLRIFTDSKYVKNGIQEWIINWEKNGWRTASKKPVANKDLWVQLNEIKRTRNIEWNWVKGHSGDIGNEKADFLANKGVESII